MQDNKKTEETKKISPYCKRCHKFYDITDPKQIFSGDEFAKYACRCPECGMGRPLSFKEVEKVFGEIKV